MSKKYLNRCSFLLVFILAFLAFTPLLHVYAEDEDEALKQEVERIREEQKQQLEREHEQEKQEAEYETQREDEYEDELENYFEEPQQFQPQLERIAEKQPVVQQSIITQVTETVPTTRVVEKPVIQMVEQYQTTYVTQYRKTNNYVVSDVNMNGVVDQFELLVAGS